MYQFAQLPWDQEVIGETRISRGGSDVSVIVKSIQNARAMDQLEVSHVIVGLYWGILKMADVPNWSEAIINLNIVGVLIGTISILGPSLGTTLNGTMATNTPSVATVRSLEARAVIQGLYIDEEDPKFVLRWSHINEPSLRLEEKAIFTAVLGGLADAAVYSPGTEVNEFNAMSAGVGRGPPAYWCNFRISIGEGPLTYYLVTKALRDVAGYVMPSANWYGVYAMDLWYQGWQNSYIEVSKRGPN